MIEWDAAGVAWNSMLSNIESCRAELQCSISNAWFRGHEVDTWPLLPSILRPSRTAVGRISADNAKRIKEIEAFCQDKMKRKASLERSIRSLRRDLRASVQSNNKADERAIRQVLEQRERESKACADEIAAAKLTGMNIRCLEAGEYDSFIDFSFRSGDKDASSWVTLAKMRHHGIPTRLLDWTESLIVALYFALRRYTLFLNSQWEEDLKVLGHKRAFPLRWHDTSTIQRCAIWILNPYYLSRASLGTNTLWSPGTEIKHDYFKSLFVDKNWQYEKPVPMHSPWENPRIASQQGMFTVHGLTRSPVEEQIGGGAIKKIDISPEAAAFGVKLIKTTLGLDQFILFRDLDSLGQNISRKYLQ